MGDAVGSVPGLAWLRPQPGQGGRPTPNPSMTNETEHAGLPISLPADIEPGDAPVVVLRAGGAILYASEGYCRLVGETRGELLGRSADVAGLPERVSEVGTAFTYRRLYDTPDGDRLVDIGVHRVAGDLVVVTMAGVTDEDGAHSDNERLTSSPGAEPFGVVVYDRARRVVTVNRTVEEIGRVRPEEVGRSVTEVLPEVDPAVLGAIEEVLVCGEEIVTLGPARTDGHGELLRFFPIPDADGIIARVGCLRSDDEAAGRRATPILELEDGVLVAPLVGVMDTTRAHDLTERLLDAITRAHAPVVILDVAGVPIVDSDATHELLNAAAVARLLGARVVVSGMSTGGAGAIGRRGTDTGDIEVASTLAGAVGVARSLLPLPA